jgi:hypothetical protein
MTDIDELRQAREDLGLDPDGGGVPRNGRSLAERTADMGDDPFQVKAPAQSELFPLGTIEGDPEVTPSTLISPGMAVDLAAVLASNEVPLRGGLVSPYEERKLIVTFQLKKVEQILKRNRDDDAPEGWKTRVHLQPIYVEPVSDYYTREQVEQIMVALGVPPDTPRGQELLG